MLIQTGPQEMAQPCGSPGNGARIDQGQGGQRIQRVKQKMGIHAGLQCPNLRHGSRVRLPLLVTDLRHHHRIRATPVPCSTAPSISDGRLPAEPIV